MPSRPPGHPVVAPGSASARLDSVNSMSDPKAVLRLVFGRGRTHLRTRDWDVYLRVFASLPNDGGFLLQKLTGLVLGIRCLVQIEAGRGRKGVRAAQQSPRESVASSPSKQVPPPLVVRWCDGFVGDISSAAFVLGDVPPLSSLLRDKHGPPTNHLLLLPKLRFFLALNRSPSGPLAGDIENALSRIEHRLVLLVRAFGSHSLAWRSFGLRQQERGETRSMSPPCS